MAQGRPSSICGWWTISPAARPLIWRRCGWGWTSRCCCTSSPCKRRERRISGHEVEPAGVLYLPARDDILAAERNISPEKLAQETAKQLRRSGLLLSDPSVLQAMEHTSLTEPKFLPLRVGRDGSISGSIASAAQLGKLGRYVEKLLHQIARRSGTATSTPIPAAKAKRTASVSTATGPRPAISRTAGTAII